MIQLASPIGTPTTETKITPRVWYSPAGIIDRITASASVCPEREYRPHERMCWRCGEPRIVCACNECGNCREPWLRCKCQRTDA